MLRYIELFAGIGAQRQALKDAGIEAECVGISEIDKYAYAVYCAIHGDTPNLGDIRKIKQLPECDLLTYSFPCQDISIAGKERGFSEGSNTRSGLLWEVKRLLLDMKKRGCLPGVLLMENVDAIVNSRNIGQFETWVRFLSGMGYASSWKILNAKHFDIPQNRARCYMVSCLDGTHFEFPKGIPKTRCLADLLEDEVDDRYFISEERMKSLILHKKKQKEAGNGFGFSITDPYIQDAKTITTKIREEECTLIQVAQLQGKYEQTGRVHSIEGDCPAVNTCGGGDRAPKAMVRNNTLKGYIEAESGDGIILDQPNSKTKRGRVQKGVSPTVMTSGQVGVILINGEYYAIRRLTPRECWRVMDFSDGDYDLAEKATVNGRPMSETQLYKQAGNSICVGVLVAIFRDLYLKKQFKQPSLETFNYGDIMGIKKIDKKTEQKGD